MVAPAADVAPPPTPTAPPRVALDREARRLRFRLEGAELDAPTSSHVRAELERAGYWLVGPDVTPDARLRLGFAVEASAARTLSLELLRDASVLQWLVTPVSDGAPSPEQVGEIVDRLTTSVALADLARDVEANRVAPAPADQPRPGETRGGDALSKVAVRRCRNEATAAACEDLARYVADHPDGPFAPAARGILERASRRRSNQATASAARP